MIIDKLLAAIGLVRLSQHESALAARDRFTYALAGAASTHGLAILTGKGTLEGQCIKGPVFLMGDDNFVAGCLIFGTIFKHPASLRNQAMGNTLQPLPPEEKPE